jgi:hypothetical protein
LVAATELASPLRAAALEWGFSIGAFDFQRQNDAREIGLDVATQAQLFGLVPHAGLHVTTDESVYAYVGARRPFSVDSNERWWVVPSFAVSAYEEGQGKDLGGPVEFRSGVDLLRHLDRGGAVGVGFYHLSNSSLYRFNPGANSIIVRVLMPRLSSGDS